MSRHRFWGTPLPVWHNHDFSEVVVVGSAAELAARTGRPVGPDLHRESVDDITIPSSLGTGYPPLRRVPEVFDCWFESGSMPYGQHGYPAGGEGAAAAASPEGGGLPAEFVAEGLDQTRGWFYTLLVLSVALFDKPAFRNVIVNGLVLASDGRKMSKRLKNYADPEGVVKTHGADALRLYLASSAAAARAEPLRFREDGVREVARDLLLPLHNAHRFLAQQARRLDRRGLGRLSPTAAASSGGSEGLVQSRDPMDRWIQSACAGLVRYAREEMAAYRPHNVAGRLAAFVEHLTNWYL